MGIRRHLGMIVLLSAGAFTTALNVTLLSPLLTQIAREFDVSEAKAGQLATLTAASSGVMAVAVAPWMDRYPRSFWFRLECTLLIAGVTLSALAPSFTWIFLSRILVGLGGAIIGANCLAACGDLYPNPADRNRAIGIVNSAFTLGAVFGLPLVAILADRTSWRVGAWTPAPFALLVLIGTLRIPQKAHPPTDSIWVAWKTGYGRVFRSRQTVWLLATEIIFFMVWFGWLIYFGAFTENVYATGAALLSIMFFVGGGTEMITNNLTPILLRNRPPQALAYPTIAALSVNLILIGLAWNQEWTMFPFIAIGSGVSAMLFLCLNIALIDSVPGDEGAVMSLQAASIEIGGSFGVAATGLALALIDNYETVFRILGFSTPLIALTFWMSFRFREVTAEPASAPAIT